MSYKYWMRRAALFGVMLAAPAYAAGGGVSLPQAPLESDNVEALQRGAATFVNYCMGCHGGEYLRYGRMVEDLAINEKQVKKFLIHNDAGLGDGMKTAMRAEDAREWFHQAAVPDLSLSARLRGPDWLYAYLRGFYRDPSRPSGWNNAIFDNVAMPHVMSSLQGVFTRDAESGEFVRMSEGRMTEAEYDALVGDLVSFMVYMGEPSRNKRYQTGYLTMTFLLLLLLATYFLYREYWKNIH